VSAKTGPGEVINSATAVIRSIGKKKINKVKESTMSVARFM